jgi:addiction module HigA family antidote
MLWSRENRFISSKELSHASHSCPTVVPATRIGDIIHNRCGITPDTALRLARFFGNSPEFWLNLQQAYDLSKTRIESGSTIEREVEARIA